MESATPRVDKDFPPDITALLQEADRLLKLGRFSEASMLYEQVLQEQPLAASTLARLVHACIGSGSLDQARCHLDSLRVHFPDDPYLPLHEGDLALAHGDFHAAVCFFRRCLTETTDCPSLKSRVRQAVLTALDREWHRRLTDSASYSAALYVALKSVFPFPAFRAQHQEHSALNDRDLLDHFVKGFLVAGQSLHSPVSLTQPQGLAQQSLAVELPESEFDQRIAALLAEYPYDYLVELLPELESFFSFISAGVSGVGATAEPRRINIWQLLTLCMRTSLRLSDDMLRARSELELAQRELALIRSSLHDQILETDNPVL